MNDNVLYHSLFGLASPRQTARSIDRDGEHWLKWSAKQWRSWTLGRLSGLIVVCFGRFWTRDVPFANARHLGTQAPPPKSESSASKIFRHSGITVAFKTTFEVFTRVSPDNSLERLTERSVGLVTDRPSDVYELFVTLL